jgi:peptidoglycan/xylan/chitin deacetylase (PgdA/CDA1 family)
MSLRSRLRIRTRLRAAVRRVWPPEPKPLILIYHRIAEEPNDPWGLAVSPSHFEEHLRVLCRTRQPLALAEFVARLRAGTLPRRAVALTFDDGYVDNLTAGKPRLVAAGVPATVFLATGYIDRHEPFWWDELARLVLLAKDPQSFELAIGGKSMHVNFAAESAEQRENADARACEEERRSALWTIWQALRRLEPEERTSIMTKLRSLLVPPDDGADLGRAMTSEEVRMLINDGLVAVGAHTVTHPVLSGLDPVACRREVGDSKRACERLTEAPVTAFAYPYGDLDADSRAIVKTAGFRFACATQQAPVTAASDLFALPRVYTPNIDGGAFERMLLSAAAAC